MKKTIIIALMILLAGYAAMYFNSKPRIIWKAGDELVYRYDLENVTKYNPAIISTANNVVVKNGGLLNMKIYEVTKNTVKVGVQSSEVSYNQNGQANFIFDRIFNSFYIVEYNLSGKLISVMVNNDISMEEEPILTGIIKMLQLEVLPPVFSNSWDTVENDNNGQYISNHRYGKIFLNTNGITKKREKYIKIQEKSGMNSDMSKFVITYSEGKYFLSKNSSFVESVIINESIAGITNTDAPIMTNEISLTLTRLNIEPDRSLDVFKFAGYDEALAFLKQGLKREVSPFQEEKIAKLKDKYKSTELQSLLKNLYGLKDNQLPEPEDIQALIDYFTVNPAEAFKVPDMILKDDFSYAVKGQLLSIMASAGTPEAQTVLLSVYYDKRQKQDFRIASLVNIGNIISKPVTEENYEKLYNIFKQDYADDNERLIANTAMLSIGKMGRWQESVSHPKAKDMAAKAKSDIKTELKKFTDVPETKNVSSVFYAAANTRDNEFVPIIKSYSKSENPTMRYYTASSLKYFDDPEAVTTLKTMLPTEKDETTRAAIIDSMAAKDYDKDTFKFVKNNLPDDESPEVRKSMVNYIITKRKDIPDYKEMLEEQAEIETNDYIKKEIYRALYTDYYK